MRAAVALGLVLALGLAGAAAARGNRTGFHAARAHHASHLGRHAGFHAPHGRHRRS